MPSFFARKWERMQAWLAALTTSDHQAQLPHASHSYLILCVDDDPDFCHYIQRLAQSVGLQVDIAYTLAKAKQKIEQYPAYHAFIIDGHLPDGSGFELVAWIRKKKELNTPIGFLSRIYQDAGSFRTLKESLKVDYVLEKPLQSEEVHQLLVQLCHLMSQGTATGEVFPEEILSDLKESYQKSIFDKVERLEKMILTAQKNPTKIHLQNLKMEVHKIAGSAGSYGYLAVSRLCKDLETQLIKQIDLADYEQVDPRWLLQLDDFFTRIKMHFQIEPNIELQDSHGAGRLPSVYIVDEDQAFLNSIQQTKERDYDILTEFRPERAVQTLLSSDFYPRILIVNAHYQSSTMNGYELLKTFYQNNDYLATVVGVIVEEQTETDQVEALRRGMTFVLTKPLAFHSLLPLLDQTPFQPLPLDYKILIVDDDPDICQFILQTLKYIGLETQALTDVVELEQTLKSFQPDLILLDIHLVDSSGMDLLDKLRIQLGYQQLLVGMITLTQEETHILQKCYQANVHDILFKPLEGGVLQRKIAHLLKTQAQTVLTIDKDPTIGLESAQVLKRYLEQLQHQASEKTSCKVFVLFEIEKLIQAKIEHEQHVLGQVSQALEELLKKHEMAAYLGKGRFAVIFKGYDPYFVKLFMQSFLLRLHTLLKEPLSDSSVMHLNGGIIRLTQGETAEEVQQRANQALQSAKQQVKEQVNLSVLEDKNPQGVLLFYDDISSITALRELFKSHAFEEESSEDKASLFILIGAHAETKGLSLLKTLSVEKELQIPVLHFSHGLSVDRLQKLLEAVNYFETPFHLMILIAKVTESVDKELG